MRPKLIAGNWKLNPPDAAQTSRLCQELRMQLAGYDKPQIVVCPPFTALHLAVDILKGTRIKVGAQNLFWEESGAYTGEISSPMIKSTGAEFVIIGHSERRQYFGETSESVRKKAIAALKAGLKPIVCVGETLEQREAGILMDVIREQVLIGLGEIEENSIRNLTIAYEPVWAIGTGKTATPDQAQEMHHFIRQILSEIYHKSLADEIQILYGGSVKPDNSSELLSQPDIDGALVGGASLNAGTFSAIARSAQEIMK